MTPIKRKEFIIDYLRKNHSVKTKALSIKLDVTRETIRKDLYKLQEEGQIKIMHGGAVINSKYQETAYDRRRGERQDAKQEIANEAMRFIKEGDTIFLGYGTTNYAISQAIRDAKGIKVVTNSLPIVNLLALNQNIEIIMPGGIVKRNESSLYGKFAINNLGNVFVNTAFIGCSGVDESVGVTDFHDGESEVSQTIIGHAKQTIIVADHSKFGAIGMTRVAQFEQVDYIITDSEVDEKYVAGIRNKGVTIIKGKKW